MVTKEQAQRVLEILPQVTDMEAEMAETIVMLYERIDELETMVTVWSSAFSTQRSTMK